MLSTHLWMALLIYPAFGIAAAAPILFPMIVGLGLWLVLAALWPARATVSEAAVAT